MKHHVSKSIGILIALLFMCTGVANAIPTGVAAQLPLTTSAAPAAIDVNGDSLASGNEDYSGVTIATALQQQLGVPVNNYGFSGQKSTQIAMRQGGVTIQLTFSGNQLVYNGAAVTAINGVAPAGYSTTQDPDYRFGVGPAGGISYTYGTICGVHGFLFMSSSSGSLSVTFTADSASVVSRLFAAPQACSANSVFVSDQAAAGLAHSQIIFAGRNNNGQPSTVVSDIQAMVSAITGPGYLVMGIPAGPGDGTNPTAITSLNTTLASTFGTHYVDLIGYLQSQYNAGNAVDAWERSNSYPWVPYTLRAIDSRGTLNGAISSTSTCVIATTNNVGNGPGANHVFMVDSEAIMVLTTSDSTHIATCTRGYAGTTAATHSTGASWTSTDSTHKSGSADTLIVQKVATTPSLLNALLGSSRGAVVTTQSLSRVLSDPITLGGLVTIPNQKLQAWGGIDLGASAIVAPNSPFSGAGNYNNVINYNGGSGVLTIGGAYNIKTCFQMGGQGACTAGQTAKGLLFSNIGFADTGYTISTPTTGGTVTIADTADSAFLTPAGTLATLTVNLPTCSASYDGKRSWVHTTQILTALTVGATAGSVVSAPSTLAANTGFEMRCIGSLTAWHPVP